MWVAMEVGGGGGGGWGMWERTVARACETYQRSKMNEFQEESRRSRVFRFAVRVGWVQG